MQQIPRAFTGLALVFLFVLLTACGSGDGGPSDAEPGETPVLSAASGCGAERETGVTTIETIVAGGVERVFRLHVPANYEKNDATALVLNFHGYGATAESQEAYTRAVELSEVGGFVTASLQGLGDPARWHVWGPQEQDPDDFAFVREVVDRLKSSLCVDSNRIFAMGMSNGGAMAFAVACELPETFAAVGAVAASPFPRGNCQGEQPIPVIALHGTADIFVPFDTPTSNRPGISSGSVRQNIRDWAEHNGCDLESHSYAVTEDVRIETYKGCKDGADVNLYIVEGGGHTWPGSNPGTPLLGRATMSIDATALMWDFFAKHPKR
jgi:polyhydroxybutyrate depolymerase